MPYPQQVDPLEALWGRSPLTAYSRACWSITRVLVARGVDMFASRRLLRMAQGVVITGGREISGYRAGWPVPKGEPLSKLQALLHSGDLRIAASLPDAAVLGPGHVVGQRYEPCDQILWKRFRNAYPDRERGRWKMSTLQTILDSVVRSNAREPNHAGFGWTGIGALPEVGRSAFRHVVFAPLPEDEVERRQRRSPTALPPQVLAYLRAFNGAHFYQGGLSIFGLRAEVSRDPERRQPFDLIDQNGLLRPANSNAEDVYIGGLDEDGSVVYFRGRAGRVYRRLETSTEPLEQWENFDSMLECVLNRLAEEFSVPWRT